MNGYKLHDDGVTPWKQAYVATMENGAIVLAVVLAKSDGATVAQEAAEAAQGCAVWASCAYPVSGPSLNLGVTLVFTP